LAEEMADAVDPNVWPAQCSGMTDPKKPEEDGWEKVREYHAEKIRSYIWPAKLAIVLLLFRVFSSCLASASREAPWKATLSC
jgi:hypothetical protein